MDFKKLATFEQTIYLLVIIESIWSASANSWFERKRSHKTHTLRDDKLQVIKQICDSSERTSFFKDSILKPFLIERVSDTEGNSVVREHIKHAMKELGWHIEEDSFIDKTPHGEKTFVNIVARHNPEATRFLTLACHFDSKMIPGTKFIGAVDSAVPCAIIIDVAGILTRALSRGHHADLTLQLLFFDGEEAFNQWSETDSLYGARHLASKMAKNLIEVEREVQVPELETIDAFVLLDLIGTPDTQFSNWFSKTRPLYKTLQKIENRLSKAGLLLVNKKTYFTNNENQNQEINGGIQDDHIPFHRKGVPIVHLISYPFPSVWHTADDNEDALHYPTIHDIRKIVVAFVVEYLHLNRLSE